MCAVKIYCFLYTSQSYALCLLTIFKSSSKEKFSTRVSIDNSSGAFVSIYLQRKATSACLFDGTFIIFFYGGTGRPPITWYFLLPSPASALRSLSPTLTEFSLSYLSNIGLHTVNTKWYGTGTGTGETVPVVSVSVSLTVKRYL